MSNNQNFKQLDASKLTKLRQELRNKIKIFIESDNLMKLGMNAFKVRLINLKKYPTTFINQEIKFLKHEIDNQIRKRLRTEIQNSLSKPEIVSGGKKSMTTYLRHKNYPLKMIKEELDNVEAFQVHYKGGNKFRRRGHKRIMSSGKSQFVGIDIAYIPKQWLATNENEKYLLVCLNFYSRYIYVELIPTREEISYISAFKKMLTSMNFIHHYQPKHLVSDNEFDTHEFKKLLADKNIHHILTTADNPNHTRNALTERVISTLKDRIQRYLTADDTKNYEKALQKVVLNYNTTRHSAIGVNPLFAMKHNWVFPPNRYKIHKIDDKTGVRKEKIPLDFKVGDKVRITTSLDNNVFKKGHRPKYTKEIYTIIEKIHNRYRLRNSRTGETIDRLMAYHELLKIDENRLISKYGQVNPSKNASSNIIRQHNEEMRQIDNNDPKYRIRALKNRINMLKDTKARTSNENTKRLYQRDIDKLQDEINQLEEQVRNQNIQNQQQGRQDVRQQRANQQPIQRPKRDVQPIQRYENEQAEQELVPHIKAKNKKIQKKIEKKQEREEKELIKFKRDNNIKIKPKKYKDKYNKTASHYDVEIWTEDKKIEKEYDKPYWLQVVLYNDENRFEGLWSNKENKFWDWGGKKSQSQNDQVISDDTENEQDDVNEQMKQVNNKRRRLIRLRRKQKNQVIIR